MLTGLMPGQLTGIGTIPLAALSGITSNQFDAGTAAQLALATVASQSVVSGVSNQWKSDATNAVNGGPVVTGRARKLITCGSSTWEGSIATIGVQNRLAWWAATNGFTEVNIAILNSYLQLGRARNTGWYIDNWATWVAPHLRHASTLGPDVVVLCTGLANDWSDTEMWYSNAVAFVRLVKASGGVPVVCAPNPYREIAGSSTIGKVRHLIEQLERMDAIYWDVWSVTANPSTLDYWPNMIATPGDIHGNDLYHKAYFDSLPLSALKRNPSVLPRNYSPSVAWTNLADVAVVPATVTLDRTVDSFIMGGWFKLDATKLGLNSVLFASSVGEIPARFYYAGLYDLRWRFSGGGFTVDWSPAWPVNTNLSTGTFAGNTAAAGRMQATNGAWIGSNSWMAVPTLVNGDNFYYSCHGVPHVIWKNQSGTLYTNRLVP